MLAQYTYFKRLVKKIRLLPETLNLTKMLVLCYCLKETAPLGYTKRKVQCSSRNMLVIQLLVSRILIHYLIHKTFAKKSHNLMSMLNEEDCTHYHVIYFSSGYIFAHAQTELLQECVHYLFLVSAETLTTRSQPESSS